MQSPGKTGAFSVHCQGSSLGIKTTGTVPRLPRNLLFLYHDYSPVTFYGYMEGFLFCKLIPGKAAAI